MKIARTRLATLACAFMLGGGAAVGAEPPAPAGPPADRTIALVLSLHRHAIYESAEGRECPDGKNAPQYEQYLAQFPTELARAAQQVRFGYGYGNRGPNGENVTAAPLSVEDPIPFKPSQRGRARHRPRRPCGSGGL